MGIRETTSPEVRSYLDGLRRAEATAADCAPSSEGDSAVRAGVRDRRAQVVLVSSRFERLHGPPSLDLMRTMDMTSLRALRSDQRALMAFHDDTWKGSTLQLQVASLAEVELPVSGEQLEHDTIITVRLADRLHFACDFNLQEGIASQFRVTELEGLLEESRPGPHGFKDEDEVE